MKKKTVKMVYYNDLLTTTLYLCPPRRWVSDFCIVRSMSQVTVEEAEEEQRDSSQLTDLAAGDYFLPFVAAKVQNIYQETLKD